MVNSGLIKKIIFGSLILIIIFLIFFTFLESRHESQPIIPAFVSMKESSLCTFENGKWIEKEIYTVGENIYICLTMTTNKTSTGFNLWIYVLDENNQSTKNAIFEDSIMFSTNKNNIPIQFEFTPGKYLITVHYGRQILVELPIEIISEN